jgi:hypothetical protein
LVLSVTPTAPAGIATEAITAAHNTVDSMFLSFFKISNSFLQIQAAALGDSPVFIFS